MTTKNNDNLAISIKNLNKIYTSKGNHNKALDNINLDIRKGIIFGLLGSNGAGKSTLINIIAKIVKKTVGEVSILGYNLDKEPQLISHLIGYVPQEVCLDPFFTVEETMNIYSGLFGIKKQDNNNDNILEALGLSDKKNSQIRNLSGGMKRRLLVAKALVNNPKILILDEPTAGVDVELRDKIWQYIKELNERGTTILLTTHYLKEAENLCDEIAIINKGKIIIQNSKEKLLLKFGYKKIIIELHNTIESLPKKLEEFSKTIDIRLENNKKITMKYNAGEICLEKLLNILIPHINIKDITTEEADLEEVFKHLINKT